MFALRRLPALAAAAALAAGGCGKANTTDQVRSAVQRFGDAVAKHDYQGLCDHLIAGNLIDELESRGIPCELALKTGLGSVKAPKLEVKTISVSGDKALASVHSTAANQPPSDDTLELTREYGDWKISSLARPQPQPPAATQP